MDRLPVVVRNGHLERLPSADELEIIRDTRFELENASGNTVPPGTPVYSNNPGVFDLAEATNATKTRVVGLCRESISSNVAGEVQSGGVLSLTTDEWDAITGESGGLNSISYFLDINAGKLIGSAPTSVGHFVAYVGRALSSTDLLIEIANTIRL